MGSDSIENLAKVSIESDPFDFVSKNNKGVKAIILKFSIL